jgi:RimJ/RimL family protein N-acetyltransferase
MRVCAAADCGLLYVDQSRTGNRPWWSMLCAAPARPWCPGYLGLVSQQDGQDPAAPLRDVRICGSRLVLRALRPGEIDEEWRAMVTADPMAIAELPDEASFKARLQRSGHLEEGWLDLAIDSGGMSIGRIQTFVPPGRPLPRGTFEVGIGLRESARGQGHGREALTLLTDWLFEHAAAQVVEAPTDPANVAMRTVFQRVGWMLAGSLTEFGREWVMYRITRREWEAQGLARNVDG